MNEKLYRIIMIILMSLFFFCMISLVVLMSAGETIETGKSVPCEDRYGRPFEDEMCKETIFCGYIPFLNPKECRE